jgi:hypothetical protein
MATGSADSVKNQIKAALKASAIEHHLLKDDNKLSTSSTNGAASGIEPLIDINLFETELQKQGFSEIKAIQYGVQVDLQDNERDRQLSFWTEKDPAIYSLEQRNIQDVLDKKYDAIVNQFCKDSEICQAEGEEAASRDLKKKQTEKFIQDLNEMLKDSRPRETITKEEYERFAKLYGFPPLKDELQISEKEFMRLFADLVTQPQVKHGKKGLPDPGENPNP